MSRSLAAVIVLMLGLPVLAMVAIAAAGGFSPALLTTFLSGGAVMVFAVAAIFEIKRIIDLDGPSASSHHSVTATVDRGPTAAQVSAPAQVSASVLHEPISDALEEQAPIAVEARSHLAADAVPAVPEPIVLPSAAGDSSLPDPAPSPRKAGGGKRKVASSGTVEAEQPPPKRKSAGSQRKRAPTV